MSSLRRLLASLASCGLLASTAAAASSSSSSKDTGILELDLLFPHNNETYAPSSTIPIVFAIQNPQLLRLLNPSIMLDIWSAHSNMSKNFGDVWPLSWAHSSNNNEPLFYYHSFPSFATEDHWIVNWRLDFDSCIDGGISSSTTGVMSNSTGGRIEFTTSKDASVHVTANKELDLVAALREDACSDSKGAQRPGGVALEITGTKEAPVGWHDYSGNTCGSVAPSLPTPSPCAVKIDAKAAASIASRITARPTCSATDSPVACLSPKSSGAQRLGAGGAACFTAALGGLVFFLRFI